MQLILHTTEVEKFDIDLRKWIVQRDAVIKNVYESSSPPEILEHNLASALTEFETNNPQPSLFDT